MTTLRAAKQPATALARVHHGAFLVALAAMAIVVALATPLSADAQENEPAADDAATAVSFESVEACQGFAEAMKSVTEDSAGLAAALPEKVETREVLLSGIFQGTQTMLAFGERMFEASDQHEEKCKAALRAADKAEEIAKIYELVLEPTLRGYAFLVRVRDAATVLNDEQTVTEMKTAIDGYRESTFKLIDLCEQDLPEDVAPARCGELRKLLDERMQ